MSRTYSQLITLVRNWSNRDVEVLPNNIVADCLRYAADKAYRKLRVAPLEHTLVYRDGLAEATTSSNNRFSSVTELAIPVDLIEFIQIRGVDNEGRTTRLFNEKADVRTFNDLYSEKYSDLALWTRQGNCILLAPGVGNAGSFAGSSGVGLEEGIELYYYRRLPALHARFDATAANANLSLVSAAMGTTAALPGGIPVLEANPTAVTGTDEVVTMATLGVTAANAMGVRTFVAEGMGEHDVVVYGNSVPNWLKDENERVILMGALAEIFFYLQENEEAQKYAQLFQMEIDELNKEDQMRHASGGNVQVNFNGRGLI